MQRLFPVLNVVFLATAICLGVAVWRQQREKTAWQQEAIARVQQVAALRAQASAVRTTISSGEKDGNRPTPTLVVAPPLLPVIDPAAIEAEQQDKQAIAARQKRSFRINALNSYIAGLDALQLSPEKLAQVKEIILARWDAATNAFKPVFKTAQERAEAVAAVMLIDQTLDEQMTALLGPRAYVELKASTLESHLDWALGTDMWDGGAPLTPEQLRAVARAHIQVKYRPEDWLIGPNEAQAPDPQTGLSRQDAALLNATAPGLSPVQQEIFRRSLIEENQYNAAMRGFAEKQRQLLEAGK